MYKRNVSPCRKAGAFLRLGFMDCHNVCDAYSLGDPVRCDCVYIKQAGRPHVRIGAGRPPMRAGSTGYMYRHAIDTRYMSYTLQAATFELDILSCFFYNGSSMVVMYSGFVRLYVQADFGPAQSTPTARVPQQVLLTPYMAGVQRHSKDDVTVGSRLRLACTYNPTTEEAT